MKCLTIKQPYAGAIILGEKTVENRTWATKYRGPLLIHAGKSKDLLREDWTDLLPGRNVREFPLGALIGTVDLIDCIEFEKHEDQYMEDGWACGPWMFVLANPQPFSQPIPYVGKLGLFNVPDDLIS